MVVHVGAHIDYSTPSWHKNREFKAVHSKSEDLKFKGVAAVGYLAVSV